MKKILDNLQKVEDIILVITFTVMVLASFGQVLNRHIFHLGIAWLEELARYCMVYMALLATEIGLRDHTQLAITAVTDRMKGIVSRIVRIAAKLVVAVFSGVCLVSSFTILQTQIASGQVSPGLRLPMYIPYFALTLSFGIITVVQGAMLVKLALNRENETGEEETV